ncbi:Uncharacterised protein [Shigella sonnei]|nr:Uncharacterised protein [Shigella sonnei]CSH93493.1 Uncharacterised protein [Shigella sonnei]
MPGECRIHIIKYPLADHERFTRAAFFARTTIKAHCAALPILFQPFLDGYCSGKGGGSPQIVSATVTIFTGRRGCRLRATSLLT